MTTPAALVGHGSIPACAGQPAALRPSCLSDQLHGLGERIRRVAERVQAAHIRGLEIDLLERDRLIDAATAKRLREDAERYIRSNAELMPLPFMLAGKID
jgi:hypothetical protein